MITGDSPRCLVQKNMTMQKIIFLILVFNITFLSAEAQTETKTNRASVGFNINQTQNDFGVGVDFISPYFAKSKVAIKIGGNLKWLEYFNETATIWTPYYSIQIGIRGRQIVVEDKVFLYGEGGAIMLFPNSKFSTNNLEIGGYGLFGFEFKPKDRLGYYIEMGGVGTGAIADKTSAKVIYSNGFLTNVGMRITF